MVDILHLQNNTLRWSNDCRQSRGVSLEATTSCRVRTRLPRIKFTNNKSVGHKIFVFTIKYLCSLMRLPSGGVLMGFCKLRSSCPPAPCTRASHHDPWSSILFVIFGHLAGALCLRGVRRPGARIIGTWARTGGSKVPAPAHGTMQGGWWCCLIELNIHS